MRITFVTKRMFSVLIIFIFVYYYRHTFRLLMNFKTEQKTIWTELMETFCDNVQRQVENEEFQPGMSYPPIKPNVSDVNRRQSTEIPYFYSQWRSHSVLKRRLIPCDHQLFMKLLSHIDQLCRFNSIEFFMSDGTLLGSYIQHDILPWDDDVDLLIGRKFRSLFQQIIAEKSSRSISLISVDRQGENYDKVFFPWSPKAGEELWSYPFVDIIYYDENATHLWKSKTTSVFNEHRAVAKSQIFPTIWRPLGQIWLPAPRQPLAIFEALGWTTIDQEFYIRSYSHKNERHTTQIDGKAHPSELIPFYPWIVRNCAADFCLEHLIFQFETGNVTLHTIRLPS